MLHRLLYADWDNPPEAMAFEHPFREVLGRVQGLLPGILAGRDGALAAPAQAPASFWEDCLTLYLLTPALVNVALNYKICVEQGLPLHPTYYFQLSERSRFQTRYPEDVVRQAQELYLESIACARAVFALEADAPERMETYVRDLPPTILDFVYASTRDKYTWRASDPRSIAALAETVRREYPPALVVGAAHGSIMSGLIFATLVEAPLYFVRFSMFKRNDQSPVLSPSDLRHLDAFRRRPVLLFDEDVAKGTTLTRFGEVMRPLFDDSRTASVLRHSLSPCRPDFTGRTWSD